MADNGSGRAAEGVELSSGVLAYLRRALPHFAAGKSAEEAMRAVLDDDARLMNAAFDRGQSAYFPTPDERGVSRFSGERKGDVICSEISRRVYSELTSSTPQAA